MRPLQPNGQQQNVVRGPPPPQLQRTDSRQFIPSQPQVQPQRFAPPVQQGVVPNQMNQQGGPQQRPQGPPNPQQFQQLRPQQNPNLQNPQNPQNPLPQNPNVINRGPAPQQMQQQQQQPQMPQNRPLAPNTQAQSQPYQTSQPSNPQPNPQPNPQQINQQPIQRAPFIRPQQVPSNFNTQQPLQNTQPQLQNNQSQPQNISAQQPVNIQPNMPYRQPMQQPATQQQRPVPVGPNMAPARAPMTQYGQPQSQNQPQSQQHQQQQPPPTNQLRSQNSLERIQRPIDTSEIMTTRTEPSRPNSVLSNKSDDDHRVNVPKPSVTSVPNSYQQHPPLQRNDSRNSIPSRPQSSLEHQSKSPSPDYITKPMDSKPVENNLPKIPENVNRNAYESREIRDSVSASRDFRDPIRTENRERDIRDTANIQRPPSVTFKDDIKKYPIESRPNESMKSPISLNTIINSDSPVSPGYRSRDIERTVTPTSEKFRPMPGLAQERPPGYMNGGDTMRLKSSLKYSKKWIFLSKFFFSKLNWGNIFIRFIECLIYLSVALTM